MMQYSNVLLMNLDPIENRSKSAIIRMIDEIQFKIDTYVCVCCFTRNKWGAKMIEFCHFLHDKQFNLIKMTQR